MGGPSEQPEALPPISDLTRGADEAQPAAPGPPRWAVVGIFLLLLVAALAYARVFLLPVVLSFLLALVFSPVRRALDRLGLPSPLSALLIVGFLLVVLVTGIVLLADPVRGWIADAPRIGAQIEAKVEGLLGSAREVMQMTQEVERIAAPAEDADVQEVVVRQPGAIATVASMAPGVLAELAFTLVLMLLLLASGDMFYEKIVHVMPTFKDKMLAVRIARDIESKLSSYLFAITFINAGLGVAIGVAMWLIGMPNPLVFAVAGFVFNFVPFIGAAAGVAIASLVGLVSFDEPAYALLAGATYFALTSIEAQFITPYFVGRQLKMNTVVVFLSIAFWAWLWSVMGMLVAVPLLVAVRTFSEHVPGLRPLGEFLAASGVRVADEPGDIERSSGEGLR
jgi:predicted PurR-regulated permease PerM